MKDTTAPQIRWTDSGQEIQTALNYCCLCFGKKLLNTDTVRTQKTGVKHKFKLCRELFHNGAWKNLKEFKLEQNRAC